MSGQSSINSELLRAKVAAAGARTRVTHQVEDAGDHAPQCVDVLALEADGAHGVVDGAEVGLVID